MATLKRKSAEGFEFVQMVGSDIVERVDSHLAETMQAHGGIMPISGGTFTGTVEHGRYLVIQPRLRDYSESCVTETSISGTKYIALSFANAFRHTLSGNTSYQMSGAAPSGQLHSFTLIVTQPATVASITFPASVKWAGGAIPNAPTANKTAVYTFFTFDGGANWIGSQAVSEVTI